jgi:hypothetical protein
VTVTVTVDAVPAADGQARSAARLRGATQALNVLGRRSPADQQRAGLFAMNLLRTAKQARRLIAELNPDGGADG